MTSAEQDGFRAFVEGRSPAYLRTAYLLTGDWGHAEDLLQASLAKVYRAWGRVHDRDNLDSYVRRVMVNTCSSWWQRSWRGEHPTASLPETPTEDTYDAVDQRDRLRRALKALPAKQRAAVVLRHYDDQSEAEVARILSCSVGTVKSQTSRGLARLRELLADEAGAPRALAAATHGGSA
jgi:RNA polymerase sigma-70 factor (sigma-E family)